MGRLIQWDVTKRMGFGSLTILHTMNFLTHVEKTRWQHIIWHQNYHQPYLRNYPKK
jgi:hypothetical protein